MTNSTEVRHTPRKTGKNLTRFYDFHGNRCSVGDVITFLGTPHKIIKIVEYFPPKFPLETWAIAYDAQGWGITLEGGHNDAEAMGSKATGGRP